MHFSHRRHSFRAALALIGAALLSPVTSLPVSGTASADAPIGRGGGADITAKNRPGTGFVPTKQSA